MKYTAQFNCRHQHNCFSLSESKLKHGLPFIFALKSAYTVHTSLLLLLLLGVVVVVVVVSVSLAVSPTVSSTFPDVFVVRGGEITCKTWRENEFKGKEKKEEN